MKQTFSIKISGVTVKENNLLYISAWFWSQFYEILLSINGSKSCSMFFWWNESICRPATMPMPTIMPRLQLSRLLLIRDLLMSCMFVVHLLMIHCMFVCANPYIYYRSYSFHKSNNFSFFAQNVSFLAFLNLDSTVRRSLAFCDGLGQGGWTLRPPISRPIDDVRGRNQFWVERQQRKFIQGCKNGIRRSEIERSHLRKLFTSIVVSITFIVGWKIR